MLLPRAGLAWHSLGLDARPKLEPRVPELPEVELVGRYLRPRLLKRRIARVVTSRPSYFFLTPPALLRRRLRGEVIESLERIGKYLLLRFSSERRLLLHLGMTGQLILPVTSSVDFAPDQHTHLTLEFSDAGPLLHFRDTRKFGKVKLLDTNEAEPRLDKLGVDALAVTAELLFSASRKRRAKIKSLLLDQTAIAGIGNIYADESLYLARIHPELQAHALSFDQCAVLAQMVRRVLRHSIRFGGSSIDDYIHPDGSDGRFQAKHQVYGREGQPCRSCKTPIQRIVIGQRSSHFCPRCQL